MDVKSLKGIAVVSIADGARLGAVDGVLFDLNRARVRAFVVGSGGLFGGKERVLDFADVKSIGADAVMIESRELMVSDRDDPKFRAYPDIGNVTSLRVVSEAGALIGNLTTVRINPADGSFSDIEVAHRGLMGRFRSNIIVPAPAVTRFGEDVVVIPNRYVEQSERESATTPTEPPPTEIEPPPADMG